MVEAPPVAVVTGGARGIGAAIVTRLEASGFRVLAGDIDWTEALTVPSESVSTCVLDVRDQDSVDAAVAGALEIGRATALVNCAGVLRATTVDEVDADGIELMWDVNVAGMVRLCAGAVREWPELEAIVNVGSIAGRMPDLPGVSLYGATKAGVDALSRSLACELGPRGVRVNCLAPGFIQVPMSPGMKKVAGGGEETAAEKVPLGRMGSAEEIAEVAEFLLSSRASYISGAVIVADGGASAR